MTTEAATMAAETLCSGVIPYPPKGEIAINVLAEELARMCPTVESAEWLVRRACVLWREWHGIGELRALLCSKYIPADGEEAYSTVFPEGIPSERENSAQARPALAAANEPLALPPPGAEIERRREAERNNPETRGALGFIAEAVKVKLDLGQFAREEIPRIKAIQDANRRESSPTPEEPQELARKSRGDGGAQRGVPPLAQEVRGETPPVARDRRTLGQPDVTLLGP